MNIAAFEIMLMFVTMVVFRILLMLMMMMMDANIQTNGADDDRVLLMLMPIVNDAECV